MADTDKERKDQVSFEQHPLYAQALEHLQEGDEASAAENLEKLAKLYPGEQAICDLLLRLQLRCVLPAPQEVRIPRPPGPSWVRIVVTSLLGLTALLVVVVAFYFAYLNFVVPAREAQQEQRQLEALRLACQERLDRGDLPGAREECAEWAAVAGNSPEIEEIFASIEEQQVLSDLYTDAVEAQYRGDCETALPLLNEIEGLSPGYRNVRRFIEDCQKLQSLDAAWQEVEALQAAGDWDALIPALLTIRTQSPDYKRGQVEDLLYQAYSGLGRERLDGARGDLEDLDQAISYLQEALRLRPTDYALAEDLRLARRYVSGAQAYQRESWEEAVEAWEPVYLAQPGYQDGILASQIKDAYPRAGKQLIAEATGNPAQIRQGILYLERALSLDPDNPDWLQERMMAQEYLAGLQAYQDASWDAAIRHWGPIYGARPDYQSGTLADLLEVACASSDEPDPGLCPP